MERVDDLLTKNKQLTKNKHVVIIAYMNKGVLSIEKSNCRKCAIFYIIIKRIYKTSRQDKTVSKNH